MKSNNGGNAFPTPIPNVQLPPDEALEIARRCQGMTLRAYFAAHAPVTCIDANEALKKTGAATFAALGCDDCGVFPFSLIMAELVRMRWAYADAMLAAMGVEDDNN